MRRLALTMSGIYVLIQTKGYTRAVDIAEKLDMKTPSVTIMIQKLDSHKCGGPK